MIETLASKFTPITLQDMVGVKLLNRTDTKFVTTRAKLAEFLRLAVDEYYVQDFFGTRLMPYYTLYYDTNGLDMYLAHHNGRLHRQKVRVREYENEHEKFLEIKNKNNHGRTKKKRIHIQELSIATDEASAFINEKSMYDASALSARIENRFQRITLVNKARTERLTIDIGVEFHNLCNDCRVSLPEHVIIELKRDGAYASPSIGFLNQLRVKPCGFSKYALGMAITDKSLKQNNFKERLRYLDKLVSK